MGLLPHVAAREIGISGRTLDVWARTGKIAYTRTPGRWRLYDSADVARLKRARAKEAAR